MKRGNSPGHINPRFGSIRMIHAPEVIPLVEVSVIPFSDQRFPYLSPVKDDASTETGHFRQPHSDCGNAFQNWKELGKATDLRFLARIAKLP